MYTLCMYVYILYFHLFDDNFDQDLEIEIADKLSIHVTINHCIQDVSNKGELWFGAPFSV